MLARADQALSDDHFIACVGLEAGPLSQWHPGICARSGS